MNVIESSVVINQPVEDVFAYYTDLENETQWRIGVLELETTSEGPIGVGTTTREVTQFLGRRIENTAVVIEYEPNKVVAMETTSGPIPFKFRVTFDPIESGTWMTVRASGEVGGFFKLAEPLVIRMGKRQMETELNNLKDLIEVRAETGG